MNFPGEPKSIKKSVKNAVEDFNKENDTEIYIEKFYVIGSYGAGEYNKDSDLDIFLSVSNCEQDTSDDLSSYIFWNHSEKILRESGLSITPNRKNLDSFVYVTGIAKFELTDRLEKGSYNSVYDLQKEEFIQM